MSQELQFSDEYNKISVQDQCESEDICEEEKEIPMPSQGTLIFIKSYHVTYIH